MVKKHFWDLVNRVINNSDVILEILDARLIEETRNEDIEEMIRIQNKKIILVINKIDLVDLEDLKKKMKGMKNYVFISAKDRLGTTILKNKIMQVGRQQNIVVGVVGYPNTGKSSVINSLAGSTKARTSPTSGFTKGIQKIRVSDRLMLLDTPGVIPLDDNDVVRHSLIGSKNPQQLKEPDLVAIELMKEYKGRVEKHYGVEVSEDFDETLEKIAIKMNRKRKGGLPDVDAMSRTIIMDWQRGRIK